MLSFLKHFKLSIIVAVVCLSLAFVWGLFHGPNAGLQAALNMLFITAVLGVMELSLSFDNAVVNASILKHWNQFWKTLFLTVGIIIAVFGMRLIFPIVIVAVTADMSLGDVVDLALNQPAEYSTLLLAEHIQIAAFGGIFLWLVFANFIFDRNRDIFWLGKAEQSIAQLGKVKLMPYLSASVLLAVIAKGLAPQHFNEIMSAGLVGIGVYASVELLGWILEKVSGGTPEESEANGQLATTTVKAGIGGFLYLELLDASFSFDGVVGAFAITNDVIIIMLGLTIGAMAVRCLTIYLVNQGTLDNYRYLEHGAMYAIGILALILLLSSVVHLPEAVTGLIGVLIIGAAFYHSVVANRKDALKV